MRRIASLVILSLVAAWGVARTARVSAQSGTGTGVDLMDVDIMFIGAHPDDESVSGSRAVCHPIRAAGGAG